MKAHRFESYGATGRTACGWEGRACTVGGRQGVQVASGMVYLLALTPEEVTCEKCLGIFRPRPKALYVVNNQRPEGEGAHQAESNLGWEQYMLQTDGNRVSTRSGWNALGDGCYRRRRR